MTSLSYLSFLKIKKKSAILYWSITLIALHLLIGGALSIFDWLQNLHWIRGKSLTSLSHWSPTYPPICISFLSEDSGELLPTLKYPKYTLLLVWDPRRANLVLKPFYYELSLALKLSDCRASLSPRKTWGWQNQFNLQRALWTRKNGRSILVSRSWTMA